MWMLVLMTLVNSVLHQQGVQNEYRVGMGFVQLGIVELVMGLGFLYALVRGGVIRARFPALRTHPVLFWILVPMAIGAVFGVGGALINSNHSKFIMSSAREFLALPVCVIAGYRLLGTPDSVRKMSKVMLLAGGLTATMLFISFGDKTEATQLSGNLNIVRGIVNHYNADYASVAALVLVFVVMTRVPVWPMWFCVALGLYCYIGYAATLSRVGFLILLFGTASSYLLLPQGERMRKFARSVVYIPILFFACWGALWTGDQIIGRNFAGKVTKHMQSLLPSERTGSDEKAWDSRMGGIYTELAIWVKNPLMGQGFGAGETAYLAGRTHGGASIKHNGWTSTLAETGVVGFAGLFVLITSMMLIGFRMVRDRTDTATVIIGAIAFFGGVVFFLRCSGTMAITSRAAIGFGLICGMVIRAREIQETQIAWAQQQQQQLGGYPDPYVDQQTGLLVPDYSWELGHFGASN